MKLAAVDLNLLVAFDALLTERNVSRAAQKIGLSQSALSHALQRLRFLFKDELMVRGPGGMRPTPRALDLAIPIRNALEQISVAVNTGAEFDVVHSERNFNLGMSDYAAYLFGPPLITRVRKLAPGINIRIRHTGRADVRYWLENGSLDAAVGSFLAASSRIARDHLFEDHFVCASWSGGDTRSVQMDVSTYLGRAHLLVSVDGETTGLVDSTLSQMALSRRIAAIVPHYLAAPPTLEGTDLVATVSSLVMERFKERHQLRLEPPPFELPAIPVSILYLRRHEEDSGLRWLRRQVEQIALELKATTP